jgi:hypothetical protein
MKKCNFALWLCVCVAFAVEKSRRRATQNVLICAAFTRIQILTLDKPARRRRSIDARRNYAATKGQHAAAAHLVKSIIHFFTKERNRRKYTKPK